MDCYHVIEKLPSEILYEILVGVERIPQPDGDAQFNPRKTGDCFLCSSYAIIQHFCKQAGVQPPSMASVYHKVWADKDIGAATGSSYWSIEKFWWRLHHQLDWWDLMLSMETDPPIELSSYQQNNNFGPRIYTHTVLSKRIRTYLEAGYLIHAETSITPASEYRKKDQEPIGSDHMVVIDGFRTTETFKLSCCGPGHNASWSGSIDDEIHIVDSARRNPEPYWVSVDKWIKEHGGFCMWFIRPSRRKHLNFPDRRPCPEGHKKEEEKNESPK